MSCDKTSVTAQPGEKFVFRCEYTVSDTLMLTGPRPHENNSFPFSLAVFQEFLCEDWLIAKTPLAVETLQYIFKASMWRCFSTRKRRRRGRSCASSLRPYTNIQSRRRNPRTPTVVVKPCRLSRKYFMYS